MGRKQSNPTPQVTPPTQGTPQVPPPSQNVQPQGNAAAIQKMRDRLKHNPAHASHTPFLEAAGGKVDKGLGLTGGAVDLADCAGGWASSVNDMANEDWHCDYLSLDEAYEVPTGNGWEIGSALSRFGGGGAGLVTEGAGVIKGIYGVQKGVRNSRKATTEAGKMLAHRELKDAALDTTSSVLGFGGGAASMAAGAVPGLDAGKLVFDAGREGTEGVIAANEARRLHSSRKETRKLRDDELAKNSATLETFLADREKWRNGDQTMDDNTYLQKYGNIDDSQRLEEIRQHLLRHKRRRAADLFYQAGADAVDAAGSFTGGSDFYATKLTGKGLKLGRVAFRASRQAAIRAKRVHKLRKAKEMVGQVNAQKKGTAALWYLRQYMTGNIEGQRATLDKQARAGKFQSLDSLGKLDRFRQLTVPRDERYARDLHEMVTRAGDQHDQDIREKARQVALAAGVMSSKGYEKLKTRGNEAFLNDQLWNATDHRVGEGQVNVGKLLIDRQFSH